MSNSTLDNLKLQEIRNKASNLSWHISSYFNNNLEYGSVSNITLLAFLKDAFKLIEWLHSIAHDVRDLDSEILNIIHEAQSFYFESFINDAVLHSRWMVFIEELKDVAKEKNLIITPRKPKQKTKTNNNDDLKEAFTSFGIQSFLLPIEYLEYFNLDGSKRNKFSRLVNTLLN